MKKLVYVFILLSQLIATTVFAQDTFVVRQIQIDGLHRVSSATVKNYLPVHEGQTLSPDKTGRILRDLYKTGFFNHVSLSRRNDTLIIHVVERPTIGQLKISGNSLIPTDKLTSVMKSLDISEGRVYNPSVLEKIKQSLLSQYYQLGRYNARVQINVSPMPRNRVLVSIVISEGLVAKIKHITIIGNHAFDESTLVRQLDISTTGLITLVTQSDRYSEVRLEESLDKLRTFYLDHGYIKFRVKSSQAEMSPDRKSVYITIVVDEGDQYTMSGYTITGDSVISRETLAEHIPIVSGDVFSRQTIVDAEKSISKLLGDEGYLFAAINLHPEINERTKQVKLFFDIRPGKRTYVRHITFSDNNRTNDVVLRREVEQWEAAPASTYKLEESKRRLSLLPYLKNVDMTINPVPGIDDQVDVDYKVTEDNSAQATFKVGYSQTYGVIYGAGLNQKNFLGTGKTLGVDLSRSKYEQFYGIDYVDPYYTQDGISRSINLSLSRVDPRGVPGLNDGYTANAYNVGVMYGIPIGQEKSVLNRLQVGLSYQNMLIRLIPGSVSNQVNTFTVRHGRHFQEADLKVGLSRDSRDRAIFPTRGGFQSLFADVFLPLDRNSLTYYILNYHGVWYQPITSSFILHTRLDLGYGTGIHGANDYPYFKNFYAGGISSVRGYQGSSLGPRDSNGNFYGGNMLADASLGLIFPNYISDSLRTSAFVDAGNVYSLQNNRGFGGSSTNSGPLRYSFGVEADMLSPFGPIGLSLAMPINKRRGDNQETFQFALGANF